jgi:alkanesulfonate monooxygenase SsuD/methylene tetrahydromethanopterin reductase-like flavin-dependent oxidoreductase (luciferase family)
VTVTQRSGATAEAVGATHLSVMDHWFQMDQMAPAEDPMLEGYTTLGYLGAHTSRVRLGLLVTGVTYRHPGLLAKIIATLDVLSGGRSQLGIGAAWYEREHRGLGVPFPPVAGALRAAGGDAADLCADVGPTRDRPVRGSSLPAGRDVVLAGAAGAAAGDDRWRR